ncbi:unnamed protein product, partial [Amoebophrya sp. A120]|eukprot:GSA120T00024440001.1
MPPRRQVEVKKETKPMKRPKQESLLRPVEFAEDDSPPGAEPRTKIPREKWQELLDRFTEDHWRLACMIAFQTGDNLGDVVRLPLSPEFLDLQNGFIRIVR